MGRREGAGGVSACLLAWVACRGARQGSSSLLPWALVGDRGHGGPAWAEVAPGQLRGCIGGPLSMASCSSKAAASLFKRTLALSPPPRAAGGGCGRCGASGSPCATSLGGGRLRSAGSRLLQPPLPPSSPPRFLAAQPHSPPLLFLQNSLSDGLRTCFRYLNQTSRSFAAVIQALDGELRNAVCIFYLVLRALDTVEDDMTISLEMKVPMLQNFHSYLYQPDWKFMESKEKDRQVLEDFPTISLEFRNLAKVYQDIIAEVCHKVGHGMVEFLEKKVDSKQDWDKIWSKYAKKLSDLAKPENSDKAVQCLNELITNTLHHIPDVLIYLSRLKNQSVFHSCAILQVMAIATLAACYNNKQVFQGVVKIRKGQAVTLMMDATNIDAVKAIMYQYVEEIYQKIPSTDPSSSRTHQVIASIRSLSMPSGALLSRVHYSPIYLSCAMLLAALSWQYLSTVLKMTEEYIHTGEN
ncbi:squalene synthase-like isoform X6 [Sphaerodactylus townsendi]|uniref:squalene synthase-like isoform X6 n=1 Tax=Sphaerodactylus townsendi TaxID=933632 RepID=UPI002026829A|nr:squalene synthase-like isoform X6 [Sphaerodactylus townsendi]